MQSRARAPSTRNEDTIRLLKEALFENGRDKNVTTSIAPALLQYNRNELTLSIEFSTQLKTDELEWAFELCKENMEDTYDKSGYGWDDDDKTRELSEEGARFLLVRDTESKELVAFVHFRFTIQGEVMDIMVGEASLYVWDIQLEESVQRKGLGKHLLVLLELIARQQKMRMVSVPIQLHDEAATAWITSMRGYGADKSLLSLVGFDADMEGFEVYAKVFPLPSAQGSAPPRGAATTSSAAPTTPTKPKKAGGGHGHTESPSSVATPLEEVPEETRGGAGHLQVDGSDSIWLIPSSESSQEVEAAAEGEGAGHCSIDGEHIPVSEALEKLVQLYVQKHGHAPEDDLVDQWRRVLTEEAEEGPVDDERRGTSGEPGDVEEH